MTIYILSYSSLFCQDFLRKSLKLIGAGSGNRTHLSSLEGWSITDIRYLHIWSERRDSNPQHPPWQGGALPLSHFRIIGADEGSRTPTPKALDPKSSASANSATSASFLINFGGLPGNRTPDTLIKSQVLYRLS